MRPAFAGSGTGSKVVTSSKPNFGFPSGKKSGGAFAKPGFAMGGGVKKISGVSAGPAIVPKSSF